ncbi:MAG TPA: Yip1 family protein [Steroidobacteraceae bacterium]|nr:Yip1 family protein [Steroidobacteraceae bacterium]
MSNLITRVTNILKTPKSEWPVIAAEPATIGGIYTNYVLVLAAIGPVCSLIKTSLFGVGLGPLGTYRVGLSSGITTAVLSYALSLLSIYILSLIINALAPSFGGQKDSVQSFKAAAYAATAAWVAGFGQLIPWLGLLITIAGAVYCFYLLFLGLPYTMKAPADRAVGYTVVIVVVAIVLSWVVGLLTAGVMGSGAALLGRTPAADSGRFDADSPLGKLDAWSKKMEEAGKKMEDAQKSGNSADQTAALGAVMSAALGGRNTEALSPERLKGFVPATLDGLPRTRVSAERNGMMGVQVGEAKATYGEGDRSIDLEITDTGGVAGMMAFAGWANIEKESETANGYERTRKVDGRFVHEQWDRSNNSGQYSVVLGDRFVVKVEGEAANIDALKSALGELDLAALEALRNEGVKAQK